MSYGIYMKKVVTKPETSVMKADGRHIFSDILTAVAFDLFCLLETLKKREYIGGGSVVLKRVHRLPYHNADIIEETKITYNPPNQKHTLLFSATLIPGI